MRSRCRRSCCLLGASVCTTWECTFFWAGLSEVRRKETCAKLRERSSICFTGPDRKSSTALKTSQKCSWPYPWAICSSGLHFPLNFGGSFASWISAKAALCLRYRTPIYWLWVVAWMSCPQSCRDAAGWCDRGPSGTQGSMGRSYSEQAPLKSLTLPLTVQTPFAAHPNRDTYLVRF